ncbi:hypothetical protein [Shewanella salipaludis]|uniref:Beta-ketoacyl synthase N-terminal domain-containing protein n=1 Tax=Shewanella salipaludis TaxID=2723052 RepID=A0A972JIE9_9GAMM|nr:hypothetical protein [Shewanella salipaludis]NMH64085.1 hypothetical protein [Shewanella salipaludis]
MAFVLNLAHSGLLIGKARDLASGAMLDEFAPEDGAVELEGGRILANFLPELAAEPDFAARAMALLQQLFATQHACPDNECVFLILPETLGTDEGALQSLLGRITARFPGLLAHADCKIFPYGSSGCLMALAAAKQQLTRRDSSSSLDGGQAGGRLWLVAIDSLADVALLETLAAEGRLLSQEHMGLAPSEGIVSLCLEHASQGLRLDFAATDADLGRTPAPQALGNLFTQVAQVASGALSGIYLPDNGDERLTELWLAAYPALAGVLDRQTRLVFPAYQSGELGAAGGLYRLLHLYQGFQRGSLSGEVLQCEISAKRYRATGLFSWQAMNDQPPQQGS